MVTGGTSMNTGNLKYQFAKLSIAEKIIAVTVGVFILNSLIPFLFRLPSNAISKWFELPNVISQFIVQPWSLITYGFFHGGLGHIFWNMLMLYFASRIFLNLFSSQRFINVYFLGIIAGGLVYMLSYTIFPAFINATTSLIGASAGVTAVLIFVCTYVPHQEVRVILFNVKLWQIGVFLVLFDVIQIPLSGNSGGHIAHLGGAVLGYAYATQLGKGNDIGGWFEQLRNTIIGWLKPSQKKAPMKTVYKSNSPKRSSNTKTVNYDQEAKQRKINAILDKIGKAGYESLSKEEKDFLFKVGKEDS